MTITILSSEGDFRVALNGYPLEPHPTVLQIDFPEWLEHYQATELPAAIDILDVGYDTTSDWYEEPSTTHRFEVAKAAFEANETPQTAARYLNAAADQDSGDAEFDATVDVRSWLAEITPEDLIRLLQQHPDVHVDTLRNGPDFQVWRVQHPASF